MPDNVSMTGWLNEWGGRLKRWLLPQYAMTTPAQLRLHRTEWLAVKRKLKQILQQQEAPPAEADGQESRLIASIQEQTAAANRNNVTRTQAYWTLYQAYPELHWALLAHLVSRNGGWNMTDLQGEWLPLLMPRRQREQFFRFLETANQYIFQDAYPQLLLYAESRKHRKPLFHLLSPLHVSRFMRPFWESFWHSQHSPLLTVALIINEQHYIEQRIVQNPTFRKEVLETFLFKTQALLQLNQVFFPYREKASPDVSPLSLCGIVMNDFSSIDERIRIGQTLYAILFGESERRRAIATFASEAAHTGSRADYWPHLFSANRYSLPQLHTTRKLHGCQLLDANKPLYSPKLHTAWPNQQLKPPERYDWFDSDHVFHWVHTPKSPPVDEMSEEYCLALKKIEAAAIFT